MRNRPGCRILIAALRRQGWIVERTMNGHYRAYPPERTKGFVIFSDTSDRHGQLNLIRELKSRGFEYPEPAKKELASRRRHDRI